jgi:hypothetical protein
MCNPEREFANVAIVFDNQGNAIETPVTVVPTPDEGEVA